MKKGILTLLFAVTAFMMYGQQWNAIKKSEPSSFQTTLISSSEDKITVNVQVPGFFANQVVTPQGEASVISVPKSVSTFGAGEPDLPMIAIPVIIGDQQHYSIHVIDAQYTDYAMEVAPSKGDFTRDIDPATVPYTYGEAYSQDAFFPAQNVDVYSPYILRDYRGQNMVVYPFAYNPVSKTLRVYHDMTVELFSDGQVGENQKSRKSTTIKMDPEVGALYSNQFINYQASAAKYTIMEEQGDLLIICHDAFIDAMTPFVNWKRQTGRQTTIVGTSVAGTTDNAIHSYILDQYNANNNLTHILLVGDVAQIPGHSYQSSGYNGKSDNWYGQILGNDSYNDLFVGRFSAENTDHVTTQVNKVLHYERDITAADTWVSIGTGVATYAGSGGHFGEDDWQHIDNIKNDLLAYNYTEVYRDYQNAGGANSNASTLSSHINAGLSIINYCNHGSETSWGVFNYSNSHVNNLTNVNKFPIVWSVACLNGKYDYYQPCFGETWLRANNGNNVEEPTGAIGGMFSYISQPWVPPMYGQDEMVDILVESYSNNIKRTSGGTSMNGNMKILDQYGQNPGQGHGTYMAWILFGDPTLTLRNAAPVVMTVNHAPTIAPGATSFGLTATNADGAQATLTLNNQILGTATIQNGSATISCTAPGQTGTVTLTVFGYNKVTYTTNIIISSGGGNDPVNVAVSATPTVIARGQSATLNAQATGGNWTFNYSWSPATGLNNANIQSPTATPTITTTYTCTVTSGSQTGTGNCTVTVVCPPDNVTANVNSHNVTLTWNAANPAQFYKVYRNNVLVGQNVTATTYSDNNLNPGTYNYQVSTVYNGIESPKSSIVSAVVVAELAVTASANPRVVTPGQTSTLNAVATGGSGNYSYSWSPSTGLSNANIQSPIATINETITYTVTVTSGSNQATADVTIQVVTAPTALSTEANGDQIELSWTAPALANSYKVYRNGAQVAQGLITPHYVDQNLAEGEYCYTVSAVYQNVESQVSNESCAEIFFCKEPEEFTIEYVWNDGEMSTVLSWNKPDNADLHLVSFGIYRGTDEDNLTLLETIPNNPSNRYNYVDANVEVGEYYYRIGANYNEFGECYSETLRIEVTSIEEEQVSANIYPNPSDGMVTIAANGMNHISIVSVLGQVVYNADVEGNEIHLNMSQLQSGIYVVRVNTAEGVAIRRLTIN